MSNDTYHNSGISSPSIAIPFSIRFWSMLLLEIPSIICSIFALGHFLFDRTLRRALNNHIIIILLFINLIVQFTTIPWILNYYRLASVWPATSSFCLCWVFLDEALYITITVLFAWATIERHILIFHDQWLSTHIQILFIHYLPICFLLSYSFSYNIRVVIFPPCENTFDYSLLVCDYPLCYYDDPVIALWDVVLNDIIPTVIIVFCSVTLLGRILYQKHRMRRPINWRKHRKMAIQLLSITVLYLILYIPAMLLAFAHLCGISAAVGADFMLYAKFFSYFGNLLLPFVCVGSLPELQLKIRKICACIRPKTTRTIVPQPLPVS